MTLTRLGPVHFQQLEQELEPGARCLTGRLLNAGCGTRDIGPYLRSNGAMDIVRYDVASNDPEVVIGPLESMPFPDASFDSVLCNAVLEHVEDVHRSMREIGRVVKPGGHVVVAIPFLQPFHACPGDFRRYTGDGLAQLGRDAGLDVVEVLPVHSFAQTIGWLVWAYAAEKRGVLRLGAAWVLAFGLTRFRYRTDRALRRNANTYQAVFTRRT